MSDDGNGDGDPQTQSQSLPSQSSNLYLVTFLATLFLLLFVSCAIVLRSFVLRRRYNRRLQQAMAQGIFLSPRAQGSKRKRFGARPNIIDRHIAPGGPSWSRTTPLYAQPVYVKRRVRDRNSLSTGPSAPHPSAPLAPIATPTPTRGQRILTHITSLRLPRIDFIRRINGLPRPPPPRARATPPQGTGSPALPPGYKVRVEMMQVAVLIAMPDQRKPAWKSKASLDIDLDEDEEGVLPELVFGVTRVGYRQTKPPPQTTQPRGQLPQLQTQPELEPHRQTAAEVYASLVAATSLPSPISPAGQDLEAGVEVEEEILEGEAEAEAEADFEDVDVEVDVDEEVLSPTPAPAPTPMPMPIHTP